MTELRAAELGLAARVAAILVALTAATAVGVRVAAPETARELLGFDFGGVPRRPDQVVGIFANNLRVLGALLAACAAAQLARHAVTARWEQTLLRAVTSVCDVAVIAGCALHLLLIGSALGAYGRRTLELVLAHGPFELVAFSLALALYVDARRMRLPVERVLDVALLAPVALAFGAVLEVYA